MVEPILAEAWTPERLAARIQHTLIGTGTTRDAVVTHCRTCLEYGFDASMVAGNWVTDARRILAGSKVKLASAIDFPLGAMSTAGRVAEARALVAAGAQELDITVQLGWLRSGRATEYRDDIAAVVAAAAPADVKVMLELPLLTEGERDQALDLAIEAGATWVKNASSSAVGIASPAEMHYLRARAPGHVRVKGSGGIATRDHAIALLEAGADLVGSSTGVAIVAGREGGPSY